MALKLARALRKAPLKIAQEIVAEMPLPEGFASFEVAGAGYINARLDRSAAAEMVAKEKVEAEKLGARGKVLVEHTSINPNKAAHIGHLRNSILGDTLVRLLRAANFKVDVQNYIDNTGVQVADVVVGFEQMAKVAPAEVDALISQPRFDYYCWDLYAKVSQWYEQDKTHLEARRATLHALEEGGNQTATLAQKISMAVLHRHLRRCCAWELNTTSCRRRATFCICIFGRRPLSC